MALLPPIRRRYRFLRLLGAASCLLIASSCSWSLNDFKTKLTDPDNLSAGSEQIRLRMRSLVDPLCGEIERSADQIYHDSNDPKVKRAALEWKSHGVPALREALFQPGPLTATLDTWVLINQMTLFYDQGDGAKAMGSSAPIAVSTCLKMEREFNEIACSLTKDGSADTARKFARDWAAKHPIKGSIAYRESTLTRALEVDISDEFTASDAIANITLTVDDLNRRIEIYSDQVVRQARWEAQLFTSDLTEQYQLDQAMPLAEQAVGSVAEVTISVAEISTNVDRAVTDLDQLLPMIERLIVVTESAPQIIAAERAIAIKAAQDEITRTIKVISQERQIALEHISSERLSALQSLHEIVATERKVLTSDLAEISTGVVDHTFSRVIQLVIGLIVAVIIILLIGLILVRRMISGLIAEKNQPSS